MLCLPDGSRDFDSRDEKTGGADGLIGVVEGLDAEDGGSDELDRPHRTWRERFRWLLLHSNVRHHSRYFHHQSQAPRTCFSNSEHRARKHAEVTGVH